MALSPAADPVKEIETLEAMSKGAKVRGGHSPPTGTTWPQPSVEQEATGFPGDYAVFYPPTNMDEFSDYSSSSEDSKYLEQPKKGKNHKKPQASWSIKTRHQARKDSDRT